MNTFGGVLSALKNVVLLQDRVARLETNLDRMADQMDGLREFSRDLDKRLYAVEKIMDLGIRKAQQKRIEGE